MDETLNRLLEAERRAEALVDAGSAEREALVREALEAARRAESAFATRRNAIREAALAKARERAEQTGSELRRRHDEQARRMRETAGAREPEALEAVVALVLGRDAARSPR